MGKLRKSLALGALAGLVVPPIAAACAKQRIVPVDDDEADEVCLVTIFDGTRYTGRSPAFRGGTALCWYGGLDIDLRETRLAEAGARLRIRSVFGGVRLVVPEGWHVTVRSTPLMGGVDDDTGGGDSNGPLLEVEATAIFGGIRIVSRLGDDEELLPPPAAVATAPEEAEARPAGGLGNNVVAADEERAEVLARAEAEADAEATDDIDAGSKTPEVEAADGEPELEVEAPADEAQAAGDADAGPEAPADEV